MLKITAIFLLTILIPVSYNFAEESERITISGKVVDINWVSDTISVLYTSPETGQNDEINIKITSETDMRKGTSKIFQSDILLSDQVTVTYYDDGSSGLKATRLTDLNLADSFH